MSVADTLNLMSALYNSDNFRFLKYFYKNNWIWGRHLEGHTFYADVITNLQK